MKTTLNQVPLREVCLKTTGNPRGNPLANHGQNALEPAPLLILAKTTGMTPSYVRMRTCAHMRMRTRARARGRAYSPYVPWCESYQRLSGGLPVVCPWFARGFSDGVSK